MRSCLVHQVERFQPWFCPSIASGCMDTNTGVPIVNDLTGTAYVDVTPEMVPGSTYERLGLAL